MIVISERQGLELLAYLANTVPNGISMEEREVLIHGIGDVEWAIADQLKINIEDEYVDILTLKVKNYMEEIKKDRRKQGSAEVLRRLGELETDIHAVKKMVKEIV